MVPGPIDHLTGGAVDAPRVKFVIDDVAQSLGKRQVLKPANPENLDQQVEYPIKFNSGKLFDQLTAEHAENNLVIKHVIDVAVEEVETP